MTVIPLAGQKYELGLIIAETPDFMARGLITDARSENKFGRNTDIDSGITADIWDGGNTGAASVLWIAPTAARQHQIASSSATDVTAAGTLTFALNASDADEVIINGKVYLFKNAINNANDGEVAIEAAATDTIDNLIAAINLASGAGIGYSSATMSGIPGIIAREGAGDTMLLYSLESITTAESGAQMAWGAGSTVVGASAHTLRLWGLTDWDTPEVSEEINLTGVDDVPTVNDYVIIHRMAVLTKGVTSSNAGTIDATADTDNTVTARIMPLAGQTQMAVYGFPSVENILLHTFGASMQLAPAASAVADITLLMNPQPGDEEINFITKHTFGLQTTGTSLFEKVYRRPRLFSGPGILKIQATSGTNNADVSAWMDFDVVKK